MKLNKANFVYRWDAHPYLIIAFLSFASYVSALFYGYIGLDDIQMVRDNVPFLIDPNNIADVFTTHYFAAIESVSRYYRPMVTCSFMVDTLIGRGWAGMYHLTNAVLHAGVSALVFSLLCKLLVQLRQTSCRYREWALLGASLFAVHPANVMAVGWIMGRNDVLFALFSLMCLVAFNNYYFEKRSGWELIHGLFLLISLLTKEVAIVLPFVCLTAALSFNHSKADERRKIADVIRALPWITWLSVMLIWAAIRSVVLGQLAFIGARGELLKELPLIFMLIVRHFGKMILPFNLELTPTPAETSPVLGVTAICLSVLAILFSNRRSRVILLWIGFSIGAFLLISIPFLSYQDMYVLSLLEHRLYLPNAFCMIGLIVFLNSRCSFPDFNIFRWAVISVLLLMSAFTICRLKDFKDAETFWAKAVEQAPSSDMAQLNYGAALLAENRLEEGRVHIEKSLELNPSRSNGHLTLAKYFERKKAIEEAKQEYLKEIELFPGNIGAFFALSSMYREMGLQAESEYWMRKGYDRANDIKGQTGL